MAFFATVLYGMVFGIVGGILGPLAVLWYRGRAHSLILGLLGGGLARPIIGAILAIPDYDVRSKTVVYALGLGVGGGLLDWLRSGLPALR